MKNLKRLKHEIRRFKCDIKDILKAFKTLEIHEEQSFLMTN